MRLTDSLRDASTNRSVKLLILVPRVWSWTWRVGVTFLLLYVVLVTGPFSATDATALVEVGVWLVLIGLFGPFVRDLVHTVWAVGREVRAEAADGDVGEEADGR